MFHIAVWAPDSNFKNYSLQKKISVIIENFQLAYSQMKANADHRNSEHFYVFLCPEWTFIDEKSSLSNRCYGKKDLKEIVEAFENLSKTFPDVLIVPGSIRLKKEFNPKKIEKYKNLFHRDSDSTGEYIEKNNFTKNTALIFFNGCRTKYNKKVEALDIDIGVQGKFYTGQHSGIFTCSKYTVGFEICADHAEGILKKETQNSQQKVDLHLVISDTIGNKFQNCPATFDNSFLTFAHCPAGFYNEADAARLNVGVWLGDQNTEYQQIKEAKISNLPQNMKIYNNITPSKTGMFSNQFVEIYDDLPPLEEDEEKDEQRANSIKSSSIDK